MRVDTEYLNEIRENCFYCNGEGVQLVETAKGRRYEDCKCIEKIKQEIAVIEAQIPKPYRKFDLRQLKKRFKVRNPESLENINRYLGSLDRNIRAGAGIWFTGTTGTAKSSIICYILRKSLQLGFRAHFTRASTLMSLKFDALRDVDERRRLQDILYEMDVLAIDEVDKVQLSSESDFQRQLFFDALSEAYESGAAILLGSNDHPKKVLQKFPTFVEDRLRTLKIIPLLGTSGRSMEDATWQD